MSDVDDFAFSPGEFGGTARLLPLPNLVLFPQVVQPLHIFEPRYKALLKDALDGDRLLVLATLAPGWERDYEGNPPIAPIGCLGRIVAHHQLDSGEYNVLLVGLRRVRLLNELPQTAGFRLAQAEICDDSYPAADNAALLLQRRLRHAFLEILPELPFAQDHLEQLFGSEMPLGMLTDLIAYMLDIDMVEKMDLLAETDVQRRAERLLRHMAAAPRGEVACSSHADFPASFSLN